MGGGGGRCTCSCRPVTLAAPHVPDAHGVRLQEHLVAAVETSPLSTSQNVAWRLSSAGTAGIQYGTIMHSHRSEHWIKRARNGLHGLRAEQRGFFFAASPPFRVSLSHRH